MEPITIKGAKRTSVGKKATRALRRAGEVPCELYGGEHNIHFSAPALNFRELVYTADVHIVDLQLEDGTSANAVLQAIQFHPVSDELLHLDFYEFRKDHEIKMPVPVHAVGTPVGVKTGGVLKFNLRRMNVKGLARALPNFIEAPVESLDIGDKLYTEDVKSETYTILHDDDAVICQVVASRNLEELVPDTGEEGPDADEVPATEVAEEGEGKEEDKAESENEEEKE